MISIYHTWGERPAVGVINSEKSFLLVCSLWLRLSSLYMRYIMMRVVIALKDDFNTAFFLFQLSSLILFEMLNFTHICSDVLINFANNDIMTWKL